MWDNAPLLRAIAGMLTAASILAMAYGAVHYTTHLPGLFPLREVRLDTVPEKVDSRQVLQVVRSVAYGNMFTVDLEKLRKALEQLPWVRNVSIRREFPYSLEIQLEEHQALARWNDTQLVNRMGEVFVADSKEDLPSFFGQEGTATEVTQEYEQFSNLLSALNLQVLQLTLSPRHAWQLKLSNGIVVELGREDMEPRLARFVEAYPGSIASLQDRVRYVDLRYRNGFAVGWLTKQG